MTAWVRQQLSSSARDRDESRAEGGRRVWKSVRYIQVS